MSRIAPHRSEDVCRSVSRSNEQIDACSARLDRLREEADQSQQYEGVKVECSSEP